MNEPRTYELEIGGKTLTIQHGILAQQANGAVTVRLGDTVVLVTACMADAREGLDFFPLTIDYEERLYAVGKIPGGFPRREGRASNDGILAMDLEDLQRFFYLALTIFAVSVAMFFLSRKLRAKR